MNTIEIGQQAPEFSSINQNGEKINLSDFRGKKVALYFYPKDDTPGCTVEACNFRDNFSQLNEKDIVILGVSTDNEKSHKKFQDKYQLPFDLIVDENREIVNKYEVWVEKNMYGRKYMGTARKTFLIDEDGKIINIIKKVKTKEATEQLLSILEN